ncbi:MAG: glycosyltransferase family 2 protein [Patescibacteria group bacterium]|nr:glycosyltransferase family 2 protein [Patescibacteria group bacterium]
MHLSIVIPVYNEEKNLLELVREIVSVMERNSYDYEIILVDDGSSDNSLAVLKSLAGDNNKIKVLSFAVNRGQTAALQAGIEYASSDIIVTMDSDLENDPADIPRLLERINNGYDVVSGWRRGRWQKNKLSRRLPSLMANWLISRITNVKLHDYGCTLKAYRKKILHGFSLYGEMHRFIPAYAVRQGANLTEVEVNYRPRKAGRSNYGLSRIFRVLLDLVVIKFFEKYLNKPMHFFGGMGFIALFVGIMAGLSAIVLKIFGLRSFVETPLPILTALFIIVGIQLIAMGVLAELIMRTYYESRGEKPYVLKSKINF